MVCGMTARVLKLLLCRHTRVEACEVLQQAFMLRNLSEPRPEGQEIENDERLPTGISLGRGAWVSKKSVSSASLAFGGG